MASEKHTRPPEYRMRMIHLALQRKAIVTARSLAAELEVDRKTIIRDVAFMRDRKELPVDYDPVRKTYYYLRPVMTARREPRLSFNT